MSTTADTRDLMVTIRCLVYNHAPYLRQCLDGFVMQETDFRFEAIVHDDASTDGSAEIIREYAEKYPNIIKPIIETENQYSKRDGSLRRIMNAHTHGKYVALCEGDDYWIDPLKLQKQVDFLENNSEYSMCFANAIEHFEDEGNEDKLFSNIDSRDYNGLEIFTRWIVPTASVIYKKEILLTSLYNQVVANKKIVFGDAPLFLTCAHYGKIRGMKDVVSVYRRLQKGAVLSSSDDFERRKKIAYHFLEIYYLFGEEYEKESKEKFVESLCLTFMHSVRTKDYRWDCLYESLRFSFTGTMSWMIKIIKSKMKNDKGALVSNKK